MSATRSSCSMAWAISSTEATRRSGTRPCMASSSFCAHLTAASTSPIRQTCRRWSFRSRDRSSSRHRETSRASCARDRPAAPSPTSRIVSRRAEVRRWLKLEGERVCLRHLRGQLRAAAASAGRNAHRSCPCRCDLIFLMHLHRRSLRVGSMRSSRWLRGRWSALSLRTIWTNREL